MFEEVKMTCCCHSRDHELWFGMYSGIEDFPMLTTDVHLSHNRGIFKRIWYAIRYVLGWKCRYGCFDSFEWDPNVDLSEVRKLRKLLADFESDVLAHRKEVSEFIKTNLKKQKEKNAEGNNMGVDMPEV